MGWNTREERATGRVPEADGWVLSGLWASPDLHMPEKRLPEAGERPSDSS